MNPTLLVTRTNLEKSVRVVVCFICYNDRETETERPDAFFKAESEINASLRGKHTMFKVLCVHLQLKHFL